MPTTTIIISTYKKQREIELILYSLSYQNFKDFEVIIADDGSGKEFERFISYCRQKFEFEINLITQEDSGFRKNKILNEAIKNSASPYLIFIDGDCLPRTDFIQAHIANMAENTVLSGRRVNLNFEISSGISTKRIVSRKFQSHTYRILRSSLQFSDRTKYAEEALVIKSKFLRSIMGSKKSSLLGCNFSLPKDLLIKVNGFDENYIGPGFGEDTDLEFRLKLAGAEFKSVRNLAIVFHLWHKETRINRDNEDYFEDVKKSEKWYCDNGIIKNGASF